MGNSSWLNDSKLAVATIKGFWLSQYTVINDTYAQAAIAYADHIANDTLDGKAEPLRTVEFECALDTRNKMLHAAATELLRNVDDSVTSIECYDQYADGLITASECCNYFLLHH